MEDVRDEKGSYHLTALRTNPDFEKVTEIYLFICLQQKKVLQGGIHSVIQSIHAV
jgi:hypothetical protein